MDISYRKLLTIPNNIGFGLEIETENLDFDQMNKRIIKMLGEEWLIKQDLSLKDYSLEIVSPVLYNKKETWEKLKKLSNTLKTFKAEFISSSFQVNFDIESFTLEELIKFLKLYTAYEDVVLRFSRGYDKTLRESSKIYSHPIAEETYRNITNYTSTKVLEALEGKRKSISFKLQRPKYKTQLIEFRSPNGTDEVRLWQNYITLFYYLLYYSKRKDYDEAKIENYFEKAFVRRNIESIVEYEKIDKAHELANLIFTNEEDKDFFVKQYRQK